MNLQQMGQAAQQASYQLAVTPTAIKNQALRAMAQALVQHQDAILAANGKDIQAARDSGMSEAMLDRLLLTEARLQGMIADVLNVVSLPDPVGEEFNGRVLENGMRLVQRRVPLGVVGVIYEARPNVTIDIAALCLKTGNASILRGGRETFHSNVELVKVIQEALAATGLPAAAVQYIEQPDREYVSQLLKMDQYVDMIIPRGGPNLHKLCKENSTIPVIIGGFGISHLYVDKSADLVRALDVIDNSKTHRPAACNALDVLLVDREIAETFLPSLEARMSESGVRLVAEPQAKALMATAEDADELSFDTEWLDLILSVKVVDGVEAALSHMREHNACHSDAVLTNDLNVATTFVNGAGSAAVYVNASTRFTDGAQFGLGAEVAVSTQKLHARGPMGLAELTTYKWVGTADYLVRK